ncbi:MAG: lipid-A-disaccharide synthase [Nitrospinota bacterium]|nr:lipid-A-disaccharide synthase [Nitrospinota bacterium]
MKILIVAGEESGDAYAGRLARRLFVLIPGLEMEGIGGPHMRDAGVTTFHDIEQMSSVGISSMLGKLGAALGMLRDIKARLKAGEYQAVILVDYPDFNMQVAKAASGAGIPVYYYVCPQFWAWRQGRVKKAKRWVDLMLVVFPFEEIFYKERGVEAVFFGHPLLDELPPTPDRALLKKEFGGAPELPLLGVLPGSRQGEVEQMFPMMLESVRIIRTAMEVEVVVPCALSIDTSQLEAMAARAGVKMNIVKARSWEVMNACDFLICKSGTSTLQAALAQTPMLIVYKADLLSYYLARTLSHLQWAGLPNILADREIVPELIQTAATAEAIAHTALMYLGNEEARARMRADLAGVKDSLGTPGASDRAAGIIAKRLESREKLTAGQDIS